MKVQLLFFPGCPNAGTAREVLRRTLVACGLPPHFDELDLTAPDMPEELCAWGSPTILVNGVDVAGGRPTGTSCRLYKGSVSNARGVPPENLIRNALDHARPRRREWRR